MIVTIDGPAGSGKSTVARLLAERLGYAFLDTGAMYRAVALAYLRASLDPADALASGPFLAALDLHSEPGKILLHDEDVTALIRSPEVTAASSRVAIHAHVRQYCVNLQRKFAHGRDVVCEGRDMGTAVFPAAPCKFFLTASLDARVRRRLAELTKTGTAHDLLQLRADMEERDRRDGSRTESPMKPAEDAVIVDTSDLTVEAVLETLERELIRCRLG